MWLRSVSARWYGILQYAPACACARAPIVNNLGQIILYIIRPELFAVRAGAHAHGTCTEHNECVIIVHPFGTERPFITVRPFAHALTTLVFKSKNGGLHVELRLSPLREDFMYPFLRTLSVYDMSSNATIFSICTSVYHNTFSPLQTRPFFFASPTFFRQSSLYILCRSFFLWFFTSLPQTPLQKTTSNYSFSHF